RRLDEFARRRVDAARRLAQVRHRLRVEDGEDVRLAGVQSGGVGEQVGEQPRIAGVAEAVVEQRLAVLRLGQPPLQFAKALLGLTLAEVKWVVSIAKRQASEVGGSQNPERIGSIKARTDV